MEYLGYLFAAYSVVWAVIFGYVLYMQRKQKRLQRQIEMLQKSVASQISHDK
ncbi:MAG TPA: CcmD family protein [Dehalococcoidia bacterium]|nr:CcmD family protein [Dehalococcoidia bacterium]